MEASLENVNEIFLNSKNDLHSLLFALLDIRKYTGCPLSVNFPVSHSFINVDSHVSLNQIRYIT